MTTHKEPWAPGTPCWVDLMTTDRAGAWAFYRDVFGWEIVDSGPEFGHYGMAQLRGLPVAGLGELPPDSPMPAAWTTYLATSDVAATAAAIEASGGAVMLAMMKVGDQGLMCVGMDPTGAAFGAWQADQMFGFGVANEPGAVVWNELRTRDTAAARTFYTAVFGYSYTVMDADGDYTTIDGAGPGNTVGGVGPLDEGVPSGIPSNWMTYFMVDDADATAAKVTAGGGTIQMGPWDTPIGRMGIFTDPQGAAFAIMAAPSGG